MTHPFHAFAGRRLEILYVKRRGGGLVFVCVRDVSRTVTLPQAWTDRGEAPMTLRLSVEQLGAARALADALLRRGERVGAGQGEDSGEVACEAPAGPGSRGHGGAGGVARAGDGAGEHGRGGAGGSL
ncbi:MULTISPECIES: DUF5372 family protein [Frankia]|uniref:DUF5372 family protein n=1 Tax=Frankia TaxID=1854 RepID=UPI00136627AA